MPYPMVQYLQPFMMPSEIGWVSSLSLKLYGRAFGLQEKMLLLCSYPAGVQIWTTSQGMRWKR